MSLADYQPYLDRSPECTSPTQTYRIVRLDDGWWVCVCGRYLASFDRRDEAQRWLAGFLLAASTVENRETP